MAAPQPGHARPSLTPHCSQTLTPGRLSNAHCWQRISRVFSVRVAAGVLGNRASPSGRYGATRSSDGPRDSAGRSVAEGDIVGQPVRALALERVYCVLDNMIAE